MNTNSRFLASLVVTLSATLFGAGCAPGTEVAGEQVDKQHAAFTSSGTTVGEWSALPGGVECLEGMQAFYPAKFGVSLPIAPDSSYGDCTNVGACHLWLDARPDPGAWERIDSGTPSTYDLIVYPPSATIPGATSPPSITSRTARSS